MGDRVGRADEVARLLEELDDAGLGLLDRATGQLPVGRHGRSSGSSDSQPSVPQMIGSSRPSRPTMVRVGRSSSRHQTTSVVSPKVQTMAIPDPFSGSASSWAMTGTRTPNRGVTDGGAEQRPVAVVLGVGHQGHARGQQLGPGRLDVDGTVAVHPGEAEPVVGAGPLPVLELGLGDGGAEVDVPEGRGRALGDLVASDQAEEPPLGDPLGRVGDGGIGVRPVDREAEHAPQVFEDPLVLGGETGGTGPRSWAAKWRPAPLAGSAGGSKSGSKGRLGSHRTPK